MKKVILAILDGVGYSEKVFGNAVRCAKTETLNMMLGRFPYSLLEASGEAVGLPSGQMGNSEVGHLTIGAGRVVYQPLEKINKSILNGELFNNSVLESCASHVRENGSKLHIFGLLSDGGIHSHVDHIYGLISTLKEKGVKNLYLHVVLDGRDTLPNVALKYLDDLSGYLDEVGIGRIASISGRYYAMDRENIWERTKLYYDAIVKGDAPFNSDYVSIVNNSYEEGILDEFVVPTIVDRDGLVSSNDCFLVANFRPDRLVQLCLSLTSRGFNEFETISLDNLKVVTMMPVSDKIEVPSIFKHEVVNNTLGEVLFNNKLRVLRIAEEAKFPHVTHFLDGDKDVYFSLTDKVKIDRKDVKTYDLAPEMSSLEIVDKIKDVIDNYDFICVNFANGDMVGHTGSFDAAVKGIETVDKCLEKLYDLAVSNEFILLVTADHGNCEDMIGPNNEFLTTHTTNPVYFIVCDEGYLVRSGSLSNIAPSILSIMGIEKPIEMDNSIVEIK